MISPVEQKSLERLGASADTVPGQIQLCQKEMALQQARYAAVRSKFYKQKLFGRLTCFDDLPCLTANEIQKSEDLWCIPQKEITRIVTLQTSGSTGKAKRIAFSQNDIKKNVEFFAEGMSQILQSGQRALCLMPGNTINGVTDQMRRSLRRLEVSCDDSSILEMSKKVPEYQCVIGMPHQILRYINETGKCPKSVLLSGDYIPKSIVAALKNEFQIQVFTHYGMTEFCYGGAVSCCAQNGYHIRHEDLYFEIMDPYSDRVLPWGETGEIVVTTLRNEAMPFVRYRTGDIGSVTNRPCECGGKLPRLCKVDGRIGQALVIGQNHITIHQLDDIIYTLSFEVKDYQVHYKKNQLTFLIDGPSLPENQIKNELLRIIGTDISVQFVYDKLPRLHTKHKIIIT